MNKYHNRNRIFNPIMTIHDILTLHILSSFLPLFITLLSFPPSLFFPFSSSSLISFLSFSPSLFLSLSLLSLSLLYLPSLPLCFLCLLS